MAIRTDPFAPRSLTDYFPVDRWKKADIPAKAIEDAAIPDAANPPEGTIRFVPKEGGGYTMELVGRTPEESAKAFAHAWRSNFSWVRQVNTPMEPVNKRINEKIEQDAQLFIDGELSAGELAKSFRECLAEKLEGNYRCGRLFPGNPVAEKAMFDQFYMEFRRTVLGTAIKNNSEEFLDKRTGSGCGTYYNAKYYYLSEEALTALDNEFVRICQEADLPDQKLPDVEEDNIFASSYNNFNTAWTVTFSNYLQMEPDEAYRYMSELVPPKDFTLFYEETDQHRPDYSVVGRVVVTGDGWSRETEVVFPRSRYWMTAGIKNMSAIFNAGPDLIPDAGERGRFNDLLNHFFVFHRSWEFSMNNYLSKLHRKA